MTIHAGEFHSYFGSWYPGWKQSRFIEQMLHLKGKAVIESSTYHWTSDTVHKYDRAAEFSSSESVSNAYHV